MLGNELLHTYIYTEHPDGSGSHLNLEQSRNCLLQNSIGWGEAGHFHLSAQAGGSLFLCR